MEKRAAISSGEQKNSLHMFGQLLEKTMSVYFPDNIDVAVGIIETFGCDAFFRDAKDPDKLAAYLYSVKRWVELTTGRPYRSVAQEVALKYATQKP